MIVDYEKTELALIKAVRSSKNLEHIRANSEELLVLIVIDEKLYTLNELNREASFRDLTDDDINIFCDNYGIEIIYDIDKSVEELKEYITKQLKILNDGTTAFNSNFSLDTLLHIYNTLR